MCVYVYVYKYIYICICGQCMVKRMVATVYYYSVLCAETGSELCIKEKPVVSARIAFPGNLIKGNEGTQEGDGWLTVNRE